MSSLVIFWDSAIGPLLQATSPETIVEIGVFRGDATLRLLEFASRSNCVVHSIDPAPSKKLDIRLLQDKHPEHFVFHKETSLKALEQIEAVDVALIDGDHNWYTVYNELKVLAAKAAMEKRSFPLTLLHDVDWPYGRRDLYHDLEAIPQEHRQPVGHGGVAPGKTDLSNSEGMHIGASHALLENTPRNGIRTAVEDFISETEIDVKFKSIRGFHGLGIIVPTEQLTENKNLRAVMDEFESATWLRDQCERIENARLGLAVDLQQTERELQKLRRVEERLRRRLRAGERPVSS